MATDAGTPPPVPPADRDILDTSAAGAAAIQGGAKRLAGYGLGVLLTVGSAALLFRHLGVVGAGQYVTAVSLVTIAGGLSDLGLTGIGVRELSVRDAPGRDRLVRNLLGLRTTLTGLSMVAVIAFAVIVDYPTDVVAGIGLAGIGMVLLAVQGTLATGLLVQLRLGWVALADVVRQAVTAIGIVILVLVGAGLVPFLAVQIPAGLAALGLTIALVRRELPLTPSIVSAEWRGLLREILPFALASTLGVIYFRVAIVLLSLVSTGKQTGYFSVSFRIIEVLLAVPQLLVVGALPILSRAARDDHDRLGYASQGLFDAGLVGGVGLALVLILGAPIAIDIVGGSGFSPSVGILRIQSIALGAMFVNFAWGYTLLSLRRYRAILVLSLLGVTLNIALVATFGSLDGARGAAWAAAGVDLFQTALLGIVLGWSNPVLRPKLTKVPRVAAAAAVTGALALVSGLPAAPLTVLGAAAYVALALLFRAVPPELVVEARRVGRAVTATVGR